MKIGLVLSSTPAYSETFFISKIKGLQKNGFEVVLFVNKKTDEFNLCTVKEQVSLNSYHIILALFHFLFSFFKNIGAFNNFIKLEKEKGVNTINIFKKLLLNQHILSEKKIDWLHFGFATQALGKENIANAIGSKMTVSLRGFDIGIYPLKYPDCYKLLWKKLDKLHVISNDLLEQAYQNGFSKKGKFQKITPAINTSFFSKKVDSYESQNIFLTVGRLHWKKGHVDTLLALKTLKDKGIDFKYKIVGSGPDEERIKYTVYDLGLVNEVEFKGRLSSDETKRCFEQVSLYIQYSVQEGFCNAVLEAQSMGILPIVSNAEGLSENVRNNQTGWVVPKNKPKLLAKKIEEVLSLSIDEKAIMQNMAKKRVNLEFNLQKQEREFVDFYKDN